MDYISIDFFCLDRASHVSCSQSCRNGPEKIILRGGNPPYFWLVGDTFYPLGGGENVSPKKF